MEAHRRAEAATHSGNTRRSAVAGTRAIPRSKTHQRHSDAHRHALGPYRRQQKRPPTEAEGLSLLLLDQITSRPAAQSRTLGNHEPVGHNVPTQRR